MERRDFLKAGAGGVAATATALSAKTGQDPQGEELTEKERRAAAPCGLFCEACGERSKGKCHGCGCACGKCIASNHSRQCALYACSKRKRLESCADCGEFACTKLIMNTHDPIWRTHAPCLDNLRRRKTIGTMAWIAEQRAYWADEDKLRKQHFVEAQCQETIRKLKKSGYNKPF